MLLELKCDTVQSAHCQVTCFEGSDEETFLQRNN